MNEQEKKCRTLRVMEEYRIGVRPLREGWWPDICLSYLTPAQHERLQQTLAGRKPFDTPVEAVQFVSSALGLANFP